MDAFRADDRSDEPMLSTDMSFVEQPLRNTSVQAQNGVRQVNIFGILQIDGVDRLLWYGLYLLRNAGELWNGLKQPSSSSGRGGADDMAETV